MKNLLIKYFNNVFISIFNIKPTSTNYLDFKISEFKTYLDKSNIIIDNNIEGLRHLENTRLQNFVLTSNKGKSKTVNSKMKKNLDFNKEIIKLQKENEKLKAENLELQERIELLQLQLLEYKAEFRIFDDLKAILKDIVK